LVNLAELVAVSAVPLPLSVQVVSAPGLLLSSGSATQAQPGTAAPDQAVLGFSGRLVFPGTGLQVLVGNGDGPLTQPPGLYLGGGGDQPEEQGAPAAPAGDAGDQAVEVAPDGLAPDEVWVGTDWLVRLTLAPG